ncbi:hypothetical protein MMC20_002927 [Loxospora ochrophaea]|nr:hypothetical protein [Loxospora ochrophaea]
MRLSKTWPDSPTSLLVSLLLLASHIHAQDNLPKLPGSSAAATSASKTASQKSQSTDAKTTATTTGSAAATSGGALPTIASSSAALDLPKIPGASIPTIIVPDTSAAPFMQKSSLPEGTVFICVGGVLGFFALAVLAWRGLVAWSLHRSVRRAAIAQLTNPYTDSKRPTKRKPAVPFYSHTPASAMSLDQLGPTGKAGGKSQLQAQSLFFSPTAGAGMHTPANRGSGYLPAGYYAAGNASAGNGAGMTHIGGGRPMSLSNLGPQREGYQRARSNAPSPPGTPSQPPSRGNDSTYGRLSTIGLTGHASSSSLNLTAPPQGRAPSAYLEDLFENPPPAEAPRERRY